MVLAKIHVTLKKSVLDPQGVAVSEALRAMEFKNVESVRLGKYLEVRLDDKGKTHERIKAEVEQMCRKLLANLVIESYEFTLEEA